MSWQPGMNWLELGSFLVEHFNIAELHNLCFDLGIDFEILANVSKTEKVLDLIDYMR